MAKEAYYFSHDGNARNDPKCSALINDFGPEGYGIFWMIVEILSEQENYKIKKFNKLYEGLSRQMLVDSELLRSIIEALLRDYELLLEDDQYIWSASLLRRMELKDEKRLKKVEAGRKGGIKSGVSRSTKETIEAELKQNEAVLEANEPKESKVKEIKEKESTDIHSTEDDFRKVSKAYAEIHAVMDLPYTNNTLLSKLLDEGIPADHIIGVMKEKYRSTVTTLKFYEGAIRDSWNITKISTGPKLVHNKPVIITPKAHVADPNMLRLLREAD